MIQRMAKVEILGLKDIAVDAIDVIHDQGTLHIEDLTERIGKMENKRVSRMEMDEKYAEHEVKLRMLRDKVGQMIRELNPPEEHLDKAEIQKAYDDLYSEDVELMTARIEKSLEEIERETREPVEKKNDLMVELSRLEKYSPIMAKVQPLTERVARMENMSSIALIIERKYKVILNYLNEEISKITDGECEIISADVDEESTAALVVFNRRYLKQVHDFLAVQDVNQVRLPSDLARKPIDEALDEVKIRISEIPKELERIDVSLQQATAKYTNKLLAIRNTIHDRMESMEAVPKFGQTDQVFIISGWLPEEGVKPMEKALYDKFGNKIILTVTDIHEEHDEEEAPVTLKNNPFVRYFEIIYLLSNYPRYGSVDPTIVFAIFFPIFFGLMVGDIGYGLIIAVAGFVVYKKMSDKPLASMAGFVMTVGGVWAMIFGAIYLEFFGDWIARWSGIITTSNGNDTVHYLIGSDKTIIRYPMDRLDGFTLFLGICIIIGVIHMTVGLVIGIINGRHEKNAKHIMEKGGLVLVLWGLLLAISKFGFPKWPTAVVYVGALMIIAGIVLGIIGAGMGGAVESVVSIGNVFSYARLIAIGLASVIMAKAANDLARQAGKNGVLGVLVGIIVFILLHGLNLVIGVFSPSIHALRLHLVESFGKFFEPAKYKYEPFKKTGGEQ